VNLYDFAKAASKQGASIEELIENIDIGGPTMIRAAAKNYQDVAVVTAVEDYNSILRELQTNGGMLGLKTKWDLARKAFALTARYDTAITARLARIEVSGETYTENADDLPSTLALSLPRRQRLRYGENPHQKAALYGAGLDGVANGEQLHGKELSYNNLVDLDAAWQLVCEFGAPAAAIIKHTNPCGCAEQASLCEAYKKAYEADPISAFGGVLAFNRDVDEETALEVSKLFVEAIAAPGFTQKALSVLTAKKNLRVIEAQPPTWPALDVRSIDGGLLVQTLDRVSLDRTNWRVVTERAPSDAEWIDLEIAWKVCARVTSNTIVLVKDGQAVGIGAGQQNRRDAGRIAAEKAEGRARGGACASDAFFPFRDGLDAAAEAGATAVIQPGGSVRDQEVIDAANEYGMAMVFTGERHFRH